VKTGISMHNAAYTQQPYLNQNCFTDPGDQQPGNAPRYFSNIRGDSIRNFDVSFMKSLTLPRESRMEFHVDLFNFHQHAAVCVSGLWLSGRHIRYRELDGGRLHAAPPAVRRALPVLTF